MYDIYNRIRIARWISLKQYCRTLILRLLYHNTFYLQDLICADAESILRFFIQDSFYRIERTKATISANRQV